MNLEKKHEIEHFLSEYGNVQRVEWSEEKGELHIEVKEMNLKGMQSFKIMNKICEITNNEFPLMGKTDIEPTHINVIFKKKS